MGPQVLDPRAFLSGLGYLLPQLLPIGTHHALDVGADEVREDGMSEVEVVRADEEQVELSVQAVLAVVVSDDSVEPLAVVSVHSLVDVLLGGIRYVLHQGRMTG